MLGVLLLTLRELRAKWIVVGLFVIATIVWGTMALALQLDVVDGSLAGARLFGQEAVNDDEMDENVQVYEVESASGEASALPDSLAVAKADSLAVADTLEAATAPEDATTPEATAQDARAEPEEPSSTDFETAFEGLSILEQVVVSAQLFVAGAAYWVGILLALFATGGLVASLQTKGEVDLLLSKPLSRSSILLGRLGGVWLVALVLLTYLIGGVWLVMSLKSGVWNPRFLLAIFVIWAMFVVLYGVVTLVSVTTRSAALSFMVVLAVLFATLILSIPELETQISATWRPLVVGLKHALPRFPTVGTSLVPQLAVGGTVKGLGAFGASLGIGAVLYALAFWRFARRDF